tara:strand:+ start:1520 stop:1852 length:333 start_codon:yes stop_codon:yes gene_type:complete
VSSDDNTLSPKAFLQELLSQAGDEYDELSDEDKEVIARVLEAYADHTFLAFVHGSDYLNRNSLHFQAQIDSLESRFTRIITKTITNTTIKFARQLGMFALKSALGMPPLA